MPLLMKIHLKKIFIALMFLLFLIFYLNSNVIESRNMTLIFILYSVGSQYCYEYIFKMDMYIPRIIVLTLDYKYSRIIVFGVSVSLILSVFFSLSGYSGILAFDN
jgi:hypothetical protein